MGFPRQGYWSRLPFPSSGNLPNPGIEPGSPPLQADSLLTEPPGKPMLDDYFQKYIWDCPLIISWKRMADWIWGFLRNILYLVKFVQCEWITNFFLKIWANVPIFVNIVCERKVVAVVACALEIQQLTQTYFGGWPKSHRMSWLGLVSWPSTLYLKLCWLLSVVVKTRAWWPLFLYSWWPSIT